MSNISFVNISYDMVIERHDLDLVPFLGECIFQTCLSNDIEWPKIMWVGLQPRPKDVAYTTPCQLNVSQ